MVAFSGYRASTDQGLDHTAGVAGPGVGKHSQIDALGTVQMRGLHAAMAVLQRSAADGAPDGTAEVHASAQRGIATPATALPFRDHIQRLFGRHDISSVQAHTGGEAAASADAMGAQAYATGDHVVLGGKADLHTVAHEAAHVVQQRAGVHLKGGVGQAGDPYERHADAVADRVVRGESAEGVLDEMAGGNGGGRGVQHKLSVPAAPTQRKGYIKLSRLRDDVIAYNTAHDGRVTSIATLRDLLHAITAKAQRYHAEMTVAERTMHADTLESVSRDATRELTANPLVQLPSVTRVGDVARLHVTHTAHGERRQFDFSLARHWFPSLSSQGKDLNSIMHHDLDWSTIAADCLAIGARLSAVFDAGGAEPAELPGVNLPSGRRYNVDVAGQGDRMNHFYVISGTKVLNCNQAAYTFFATLSRFARAEVDHRAVMGSYQFVENAWGDRFGEIQAISGVDMAGPRIGAKTLAEKAEETRITTQFKTDVLAYCSAHTLGDGLPTELLRRENWPQIGSSLSYDQASAAHDILFRGHLISHKNKKLTFK